jgi:ABC-2 type transport system ATP-binding protein
MDGNVAIRVRGLVKKFDTLVAVDGLDLEVRTGECFALLGPNGAGKTTMVRILTTLLRPDRGRAAVAGFDVVADASSLRGVIGLAGQYAAVDENLTGFENLEMVGRLYHLAPAEARRRAGEVLERFDLVAAGGRPVKTYSGGMRRRLDLGASLVGEPTVLFLDEPTTGLDPRSRLGLWDFIEDLVDEGTTLLLTTQYLEEADRLADTIAVIDGGKVIAEGTSDELKSRIGGDVLELHLVDRNSLASAADAIAGLGCEQPQVQPDEARILLPVTSGGGVITEAVRRLDRANVELVDLAMRRPTLDDVFLTLTGRHAEEVVATEASPGSRRDGGRRARQGRRQ